MNVTVVGAAAVWDCIHRVRLLPQPGTVSEILYDEAAAGPFCGGGAPNIAAALARLEFAPRLIYPVGQDFCGSKCETFWRSLGVDLSGLVTLSAHRSGYAYLFVTQNQETTCFAFPGAAGAAGAPPIPRFDEFVVVAPVLNAFTCPLLEAALAQDRRVIISGIAGAEVVPYLARLSALVINAAEADRLCHELQLPSPANLGTLFPKCLFFITQGAAGSTVYQHKEANPIPSVPAERVQDPTGAGDAYAAGVVAGLGLDCDAVTAGKIGAALASFVVEEVGSQTNLPDRKMLCERVAELALYFK